MYHSECMNVELYLREAIFYIEFQYYRDEAEELYPRLENMNMATRKRLGVGFRGI